MRVKVEFGIMWKFYDKPSVGQLTVVVEQVVLPSSITRRVSSSIGYRLRFRLSSPALRCKMVRIRVSGKRRTIQQTKRISKITPESSFDNSLDSCDQLHLKLSINWISRGRTRLSLHLEHVSSSIEHFCISWNLLRMACRNFSWTRGSIVGIEFGVSLSGSETCTRTRSNSPTRRRQSRVMDSAVHSDRISDIHCKPLLIN